MTAAATHVGYVRKRNEDGHLAGEYLSAVADGLGGHVAGDVASATVIEAIRPYDQLAPPAELSTVLGRAVHAATEAMRRKVASDPGLAGMGSTLVAVLRSGNHAAVANVGDSRAYLLRKRRLKPLTEDHLYGGLVVGAAVVPNLPERLSRFLDGRPDGRSPDLAPITLMPGDRMLLCSDGLSSYVDHDTIQAAMLTEAPAGQAAERLIALALEAGGTDNVTVVVFDA